MQTRYLPLIFWLGNLFAKLFNYIVSTAVGVRMGVAGSYSRTLHIHVQPQKKRGNWEFAHGDPMAIKLQNMQKYDGGIIFPPPVQYEFSTKLKQC